MDSPKRASLDCQTPDGLQMVKVIAGLEQEEENEFSGEDEVVVVKKDEKDEKKKVSSEEETEPSNYEKFKVLFIDVVNPKFKNFNRPLFLALVVGGITFAAFIALFVYLQTDCVSQSMTGATPQVTMFFEKNPIKCIHFAAKVDIVEKDNKNKLDMPMCKMVNYPLTEEPITPIDIPYCNSGVTEGQNFDSADMPNCTGIEHNDGSKPDPALTIVEFDICPDPVLTLGSAFGWVAIIELATTLFVLAVGMPAGFLVNDQSTLKTLIGEMNAEENKAAIKGAATEYGSQFIPEI